MNFPAGFSRFPRMQSIRPAVFHTASPWPAVRAPNSQKCNLPLQRGFCVAAVPQPACKVTILISEGVSAWAAVSHPIRKNTFVLCKSTCARFSVSPGNCLFAFLSGGIFSALAGYIGMKTATMANCRTAAAAEKGLNKGLKVAFAGGSVMGFVVVGLGLLDLSVWYFFLKFWYTNVDPMFGNDLMIAITSNMLTFGMGASCMALFARVGGGIFTKAADVGADLVGKVEAGIPEDDPRNPAVIADNVGDNVGDVAGMGADLFESYIGSIVSTCSLAVAAGFGSNGVALPLVLAAFGIFASILGTFFIELRRMPTKNLFFAPFVLGRISVQGL